MYIYVILNQPNTFYELYSNRNDAYEKLSLLKKRQEYSDYFVEKIYVHENRS